MQTIGFTTEVLVKVFEHFSQMKCPHERSRTFTVVSRKNEQPSQNNMTNGKFDKFACSENKQKVEIFFNDNFVLEVGNKLHQ